MCLFYLVYYQVLLYLDRWDAAQFLLQRGMSNIQNSVLRHFEKYYFDYEIVCKMKSKSEIVRGSRHTRVITIDK